ncbi:MAG: putative 2OG-Fe(II) oxygenase [Candidatus Azotimanducaceae bacterium]
MRSNGFLSSHIHEQGWISGTIYLQVPAKRSCNEDDIIFSPQNEDYPDASVGREEKVVVVKVGTISLFSATLYHRTEPFHDEDCDRVCIAFDVFPVHLNRQLYVPAQY